MYYISSLVIGCRYFIRPPSQSWHWTIVRLLLSPCHLGPKLYRFSSVRNPNFFTVAFKSITANITYPINNTQLGGGVQNNVVFKSNSKTSFDFPFTLHYSQAADPNGKIITDIVNKCGFVPGTAKQQLSIGYTLKVCSCPQRNDGQV
jgi:Late embryogenesis abundant protein